MTIPSDRDGAPVRMFLLALERPLRRAPDDDLRMDASRRRGAGTRSSGSVWSQVGRSSFGGWQSWGLGAGTSSSPRMLTLRHDCADRTRPHRHLILPTCRTYGTARVLGGGDESDAARIVPSRANSEVV
jgi:hypothetical protein